MLHCCSIWQFSSGHNWSKNIDFELTFLDSYPKLPKVLQFYPFYAYQGSPRRPYVYLRCLFNRKKRDSTVKYVFHLYKTKQGQDGKILKNLVHRKETTRSYFDVRLLPERYPVGHGDTVNYINLFYDQGRPERGGVKGAIVPGPQACGPPKAQ